jgi:hypothetical protein
LSRTASDAAAAADIAAPIADLLGSAKFSSNSWRARVAAVERQVDQPPHLVELTAQSKEVRNVLGDPKPVPVGRLGDHLPRPRQPVERILAAAHGDLARSDGNVYGPIHRRRRAARR